MLFTDFYSVKMSFFFLVANLQQPSTRLESVLFSFQLLNIQLFVNNARVYQAYIGVASSLYIKLDIYSVMNTKDN